jgi:hypothetical protein
MSFHNASCHERKSGMRPQGEVIEISEFSPHGRFGGSGGRDGGEGGRVSGGSSDSRHSSAAHRGAGGMGGEWTRTRELVGNRCLGAITRWRARRASHRSRSEREAARRATSEPCSAHSSTMSRRWGYILASSATRGAGTDAAAGGSLVRWRERRRVGGNMDGVTSVVRETIVVGMVGGARRAHRSVRCL